MRIRYWYRHSFMWRGYISVIVCDEYGPRPAFTLPGLPPYGFTFEEETF